LTLAAVLAWLPNPLLSLIPLIVLVSTFEVVRTLLLAIERIGRYVQVFYEEIDGPDAPPTPPAWERTAMLFGPTVPGAGGHPLFLPIFLMATPINFLAVVLPGPIAIELWTLAVPHVAFAVWQLYSDRAMRRQRGVELARYRELKARSG
jgi:hypothetical protein